MFDAIEIPMRQLLEKADENNSEAEPSAKQITTIITEYWQSLAQIDVDVFEPDFIKEVFKPHIEHLLKWELRPTQNAIILMKLAEKLIKFDAELAEKIINVVTQVTSQSDIQRAIVFLLLAKCYDNTNQPQQAINYLNKAIAILEQRKDSKIEPKFIFALFYVFTALIRSAPRHQLGQLYNFCEQLFSEHKNYACLFLIAQAMFQMVNQQTDTSGKLAEQLLQNWNADYYIDGAYIGDDQTFAVYIKHIAEIFYEAGDYVTAFKLYRRIYQATSITGLAHLKLCYEFLCCANHPSSASIAISKKEIYDKLVSSYLVNKKDLSNDMLKDSSKALITQILLALAEYYQAQGKYAKSKWFCTEGLLYANSDLLILHLKLIQLINFFKLNQEQHGITVLSEEIMQLLSKQKNDDIAAIFAEKADLLGDCDLNLMAEIYKKVAATTVSDTMQVHLYLLIARQYLKQRAYGIAKMYWNREPVEPVKNNILAKEYVAIIIELLDKPYKQERIDILQKVFAYAENDFDELVYLLELTLAAARVKATLDMTSYVEKILAREPNVTDARVRNKLIQSVKELAKLNEYNTAVKLCFYIVEQEKDLTKDSAVALRLDTTIYYLQNDTVDNEILNELINLIKTDIEKGNNLPTRFVFCPNKRIMPEAFMTLLALLSEKRFYKETLTLTLFAFRKPDQWTIFYDEKITQRCMHYYIKALVENGQLAGTDQQLYVIRMKMFYGASIKLKQLDDVILALTGMTNRPAFLNKQFFNGLSHILQKTDCLRIEELYRLYDYVSGNLRFQSAYLYYYQSAIKLWFDINAERPSFKENAKSVSILLELIKTQLENQKLQAENAQLKGQIPANNRVISQTVVFRP